MAEQRAQRRLAAILAADVVGYSRLMGEDETGTLSALKEIRAQLIDPTIAEHQGRIVKLMGDGALVEFASVVDAVECAIRIQRGVTKRNADIPDNKRIVFRIGVNLGDIIIEGDDIYGDGVNVAARLEGEADPGGICISGDTYRQVQGKIDCAFEDLGERSLKNIAEPVRAYRITLDRASAKPSTAPLPLPDKPSIAVLPFDNMSGDPDQDYFADGLAESITSALSHIRSFFVIARNSAFTYKGKATNIETIGLELGVSYVLEGSVQRAGNRIRVTAQLIETDGGMHIWSDRYDGKIDDVFDFQDRITENVAGALQPSIRISEIERSRRKQPNALSAYDYAMRAMPHVWALEEKDSASALGLLNTALEIDPDYPLALSLAAWCHGQRAVYNWTEDIEQSQADAMQLAEKAAGLSADDSLNLAVLGAVHSIVRSYGTARVFLERAVAIDPNSAWAWSRLGWLGNYTDNPEQATKSFEQALRLSPLDPMNFNNLVGLGTAFEIKQDNEQAIELYKRALQERPHLRWIDRQLAGCLFSAGRLDEAKQVFERMLEAYPDLTATKIRGAMVLSPSYMDRLTLNLKQLGLPD